jgi:trans-2,3-dihydro-3-hydroxyanthranilate isomerase
MFAPSLGIAEDPATGSAATALGGYLGVRHPLKNGSLHWIIEQGFEIGRPSLLQTKVEKKNSSIKSIRVGGNSVLVSRGTLELD